MQKCKSSFFFFSPPQYLFRIWENSPTPTGLSVVMVIHGGGTFRKQRGNIWIEWEAPAPWESHLQTLFKSLSLSLSNALSPASFHHPADLDGNHLWSAQRQSGGDQPFPPNRLPLTNFPFPSSYYAAVKPVYVRAPVTHSFIGVIVSQRACGRTILIATRRLSPWRGRGEQMVSPWGIDED